MPSQGKVSKNDIERLEIRDIIPMHIRLSAKDIDVSIHFRTWEVQDPLDDLDTLFGSDYDEAEDDETGLYASCLCLTRFVPNGWVKPTAHMRALAEATMADDPWRPLPRAHLAHAIRNYDPFRNLLARLKSDKSTSMI